MKGHAQGTNTLVYFCRNLVNNSALAAAFSDLSLMEGVVVEAVPCGGRIDPRHMLKAFEGGAHGVALVTCPVTQCRMMEGNLRAIRRVGLVREYLAETGLDPDRVKVFVPDDAEESSIRHAITDVGSFACALAKSGQGVTQR